MKHVTRVAPIMFALCVAMPAAGAPTLDAVAEAAAASGEDELGKEYEDIDRMLREDDPGAPVDYGYGPGVMPPRSQGPQASPVGAPAHPNKPGTGAGR